MQYARRKNRKGRAIEGLMVRIRKEIEIENLNQGEEKEGIMGKVMKLGEEKWRLIGVYVREDIEGRMEFLRRWMEEQDGEMKTIIGRDFNARTGEKGGGVRGDGEEEERKSKDKRINKEAKIMIEKLGEIGWEIMNAGVDGDEEKGWRKHGN